MLSASDTFENGALSFSAHFDPTRYRVLVDEGALSAAEYESIRMQMLAFVSEPSAIVMMVNLLMLGTKPGAAQTGLASEVPPLVEGGSGEGLEACGEDMLHAKNEVNPTD